jgi:hypothetical protein
VYRQSLRIPFSLARIVEIRVGSGGEERKTVREVIGKV